MLNKNDATIDCNSGHPLITFMLFTYNQEKFICEAVKSAFSQTYSPLEIILSDDCSSDATFELMKEMVNDYQGSHKIVLNRNNKNLGIGRHYNKLMDMARGEIILLAAGDDISLPERTNVSWEILRDNPEVMSVSLGLRRFSGVTPVDLPQDTYRKDISIYDISNFILHTNFHLNAPARAFRKYTHTLFGPLNDDCSVEDGPNLLRSLLHGKVASSDNVAVLYRIHGDNYYASDNKYSIDFKSIFSNYYSDINKAYKLGIIDDNIVVACGKSVAIRELRETVKIRFYRSNNKLYIFIVYIILSRAFSRGAKLNYFKQAVPVSILNIPRNLKILSIILGKLFKVSDYDRWGQSKSLKKTWDPRTVMIAKLIPPNKSILEFGAGRMVLKKHLHSSCSYTPSDIIDRGSGTLIVNLNSKPYTFLNNDCNFDIAVFSGVLEYIHDLESLLIYLRKHISQVILSYACRGENENYLQRRGHGWVNDYTYSELTILFEKVGFFFEKRGSWKQQNIYILNAKI